MNKVPNIVFLLIAIAGLTAAGVLFALFSSEKEKSFNSLNEIAELKKTNETLMNKNSDLMMQMGGIEDQKKKLEEKTKEQAEESKNNNELIFNIDNEPVGITKIKGYYSEEERFGEGEEAEKCNTFSIIETPETFYNYLKSQIENPSDTWVYKNAEGSFSLSINSNNVSEDDWNKIINSSVEQPLEMIVFKKKMRDGYGAGACESIVDILKVN